MDKYRIDSHKLMFHVQRVNDWLNGEKVYPIYMEVSPAGICNHRCSFCGLDFMGYQRRFLRPVFWEERLEELGRLGVKSIMYSGEGEPLLHKNIGDIVEFTRKAGIDVAITSNGVLLKPEKTEKILPHCEWIKISINAGRRETYAKVHKTRPGDFDRVIANIARALEMKETNGWSCTIGMQMILLPENQDEVFQLADIACEIGVDYLVIKPFSQHVQSRNRRYQGVTYTRFYHLSRALERYNSDRFSVIVRAHTMAKWDQKTRSYHRCYAMPFWSYIDSGGNVWGCSVYLEDDRFHYGNIYTQNFKEIWNGERRAASLSWVENFLNISQCRINCRMDEINAYLWQLKHPPAHVNFI